MSKSDITLQTPVPVSLGGTGRATLTDGAILVGNGTAAITMIGPLTDGQLLIGDTAGVDPVAAALTAGEAIDITLGAGSIQIDCEIATITNIGVVELATDAESQLLADEGRVLTPSNMGAVFAVEKQSGFQEWTGAGSYYTINTTDFVLDRPGIGWINTVQITWAGAQTVAALTAGNTHYIYIDDTGTIGSTTTRNTALYQDNIVLFEVLVDSDTPANVIVTKENHSLQTHPSTMNALHELGMHGYDVVGAVGGTIALNGTVGIQVNGTTEWHDHDLETTIPDSAAAAITMNIMYTDGAGKWVVEATQNTLPTQYNNAGTPTNLAGNQRGIYDILVGKDDIESANPQYFAVMDDTLYANLALAEAAVAATTFASATNELAELEMIRMGVIIINATVIDSVTVSKQTIGTGNITSVGSTASVVSTDTTNFDGWLSAADTTVQAALETLDEVGKGATIDPGATGDSYIQFDINTTGEFIIGVDDDAGDAFKISQGSALGANDTFIMTAAGERTLPLNPCFQANNASSDTDVTGDGTTYQLEFNNEIFDQGGDYDDGTDTFTAPVTGTYLLTSTFMVSGWDNTHTTAVVSIATSNRTYYNSTYAAGTVSRGLRLTVIADMDAADTAVVQFTASGGNKVLDVHGGTDTLFFGNLIS